MRRLFRKPVAWMVLAEVAVVGTLGVVTWHELAGIRAAAAPLILPSSSPPDASGPVDIPSDALTPPSQSTRPLLPGLNVDPAFWREHLVGLNLAEAQFEALEWRIIHSAMETIRRYVDTVVVPAIERGEKGGGRR